MPVSAIASLFEGVLAAEDLTTIRRNSRVMEARGALSEEVLRLIIRRQWLKIMEPAYCHGLEWPLPDIVHLFEALAYADGNVGWCVNLGAGANLFSGYFPKETARRLFSAQQTWCAGSGFPGGKAYREVGGYRLTGSWKYASGSAHATHFTANAYLFDAQGEPVTEGYQPVFRSFIFPADKVTVLDTWHVSGLKATSSRDFEVKDVWVPDEEVFDLTIPSPFAEAPVFHFPFGALAVLNMAIMPCGMALHFLELFEALMERKKPLNSKTLLGEQDIVRATHQDCKEQLLTARSALYEALATAWQPYEAHKTADADTLQHLSDTAVRMAQVARATLYRLFPFCGMSVIYRDAAINKVWRDLSVAGQHYLLLPKNRVEA